MGPWPRAVARRWQTARGGARRRECGPRPSHRIGWAVFLVVATCSPQEREELAIQIVGEFPPPPEGSFWAPIDVAASGDRVWVLDIGAAQVYGYGRDGGYRTTVGRKGGGPGELREPTALGAMGDTLWVLNGGNRRIEYFSVSGSPLGSDPLPDSLPPAVDLVRLAGEWFMSTPFSPRPLIRFDLARGTALAFGAELERRARELAPKRGIIPSVYRLEAIDGRLWAFHLYLPLVGVYDAKGRLGRLLSFSAPGVEAEVPIEQEAGEGRVRRLLRAPRAPAGVVGFLEVGRDRYLATRQRVGDQQTLYRLVPSGVSDQPTLAPSGIFFMNSIAWQGRSYVIGMAGEDEEPTVFVVE